MPLVAAGLAAFGRIDGLVNSAYAPGENALFEDGDIESWAPVIDVAALGADAIGLVLYPASPRRVDPATARALALLASPFVTVVGLFVDVPLDEVRARIAECRLDAVQLHGAEPPEFCRELRRVRPVIKALRMQSAATLDAIAPYAGSVDAILLDAYLAGRAGGTGRAFDWAWAAAARARFELPLILAGGLNPANVAAAVAEVAPYAVDVSSGVESAPGRKDPELIRAFLANLRGVCS